MFHLKQTGTSTVSATLTDQVDSSIYLLVAASTVYSGNEGRHSTHAGYLTPFAVVLKDETSHPDYSEIKLVTRPSLPAAVAETDQRLRSSIASYIVQVYRLIIHLPYHPLNCVRAGALSSNPEPRASGSQLPEKQET